MIIGAGVITAGLVSALVVMFSGPGQGLTVRTAGMGGAPASTHPVTSTTTNPAGTATDTNATAGPGQVVSRTAQPTKRSGALHPATSTATDSSPTTTASPFPPCPNQVGSQYGTLTADHSMYISGEPVVFTQSYVNAGPECVPQYAPGDPMAGLTWPHFLKLWVENDSGTVVYEYYPPGWEPSGTQVAGQGGPMLAVPSPLPSGAWSTATLTWYPTVGPGTYSIGTVGWSAPLVHITIEASSTTTTAPPTTTTTTTTVPPSTTTTTSPPPTTIP